ncbi:MAG: T9SS type A sorting domain-containing protein [bacterium]
MTGTKGGAGYRWSFPAGITEKASAGGAHLLFSPNPAFDRVSIQVAKAARLALYDGLGRKVWQASGTRTTTIDLSRLPPGVYHLKAQTELSGPKLYGRLVIVR